VVTARTSCNLHVWSRRTRSNVSGNLREHAGGEGGGTRDPAAGGGKLTLVSLSRGSMSRGDMEAFLRKALSSFGCERDNPHERLIASLRARQQVTAHELAARAPPAF
jgi:hypothetical protein